ncbi:MAG: hypothetical protein ACJAVT_001586 [Yoonia sp.]|jgi:hypothetical protein
MRPSLAITLADGALIIAIGAVFVVIIDVENSFG